MGWTTMHRKTPVKDWFASEINSGLNKVVEVKIVHRKELYAAIQKENGEVVAFMYLLDYKKDGYYNFGYKSMDETCMPYYFKCPKSILDKLTPTTNEYAIQWREECRKYHQNK